MEKTYQVIYYLSSQDWKPGVTKGVALVVASSKADASYKFKQMGIPFYTIDKIVEC